MNHFMHEGKNEGTRADGTKVIRFWAAADTWDRATISVRVNYREWLAATKDLVQIVEVGSERRYRPESGGRGVILPHVEVIIVYIDAVPPRVSQEPVRRAKPTFADRTCKYCGKTFSPTGSIQRFCDEVCRRWYDLEQAEIRKNNRGIDRDQGV